MAGLLWCSLFLILHDAAHGQGQPGSSLMAAPPPPACVRLTPGQTGQIQDRIQEALDHCPAGQAVFLQSGDYVSGPLSLPSGVFLHLAAGSVLHASSNPADYDRGTGLCGQIDDKGKACRPFLLLDHSRGGGIYGPGIIDGQGGSPMAGQPESWWQLARRAQREGGRQNTPRLIEADHARNLTFAHLTLRNAPNFHIVLNKVKGAMLDDVRIDTPPEARNTDGIDPISSEDITITRSFIRTGDDNIAIKAGHAGPARHITVSDTHLYWGHGLSIGSETMGGVSDVRITNVSLDGTRWGLRIKSDRSRGGLVHNIRYEEICLRNSPFPLWFDTYYDAQARGEALPLYRDITLRHVRGDGGMLLLHGLDESHILEARLDDVLFPTDTRWSVSHAHLLRGPSHDETSQQTDTTPCATTWRPFPQP